MGLDSVELIMEAELYFGISIPNRQAENIATVKNFVNTVCQLRQIPLSNNRRLHWEIFDRLATALESLTGNFNIQPEEKISAYLSFDDTICWQDLSYKIALELPRPQSPVLAYKWLTSLLNVPKQKPQYDWESLSLATFTDAICACNYRLLLSAHSISTPYEVYIAITGLIVDKIGVDYFEIVPASSLTSDLGID